MLRESSQRSGTLDSLNLQSTVNPDADSGVPQGSLLTAFAEAAVRQTDALPALREQIKSAPGVQALVDAAGHVANLRYEEAAAMMDPDVNSFSTWQDVVVGVDHFVNGQWRNVWPTMTDFVLLTGKTAGRLPDLAEIESRVRSDAEREAAEVRRDAAIEALVDTYEVRRQVDSDGSASG